MSSNNPSFQILLTKAGPILVPVPAGWTSVPLGTNELVLEGPCDPALTWKSTAYRIKSEWAQVTLRYDDNGELAAKCRVRRRGQKHSYNSAADAAGSHYSWKPGTTGVTSKTDWVLRVLAQNGRGL